MFSCCVVGAGCPLLESKLGMPSVPFDDGIAVGAANTDAALAETEVVVVVPVVGDSDCGAFV